MKKLLLLSSFCLLVLLATVSFKAYNANTNEYITMYWYATSKNVVISDSKGIIKEVPVDHKLNYGDQRHLLKLMNEYEALGYTLVTYDCESGPLTCTVLMAK